MWQRQIQPAALLRDELEERRGLGVVDEADVPSVGELAGIHLVVAAAMSPIALRRGSWGAPWSALCMSLVALKNSSRP